jgi:hypothetical protein
VPSAADLIILSRVRIPPYAEWIALLETRQTTLLHVELHTRHRHAHVRCRTQLPLAHIEGQLATLPEGGMTACHDAGIWPWMQRIETPPGTLVCVLFAALFNWVLD